MMDLTTLTTAQLMHFMLTDIPEELRRRGLPVSRNVIGSYGELIACRVLGMTPATGSTRGYDAIDPDGSRVQIKSRYDGRAQMGSIRSNEYDEVVFIHLNDSAEVTRALRFPASVVNEYARTSRHQNSKILVVSLRVLADPRVVDITELFRAAAETAM